MKRRRVVAVVVIAPALGMAVPAIPPVVAQDACTTWTVGMMEDEGGPVLTAQACTEDRSDAFLSLTRFAGRVFIRYDLAAGSEVAPRLEEVTDVTFSTGNDAATIAMAYEEMDGRHAANAGADDALIQLLRAGDTLTIRDVPAHYPEKHFSLAGSAAAIGKLTADCR